MTIHRNPDAPHMFCPSIARQHGIKAAVVDYTMRELSQGCTETNEIINVPFEVEDITCRCDYFTEEEVRDAISILANAGLCEVTK